MNFMRFCLGLIYEFYEILDLNIQQAPEEMVFNDKIIIQHFIAEREDKSQIMDKMRNYCYQKYILLELNTKSVSTKGVFKRINEIA